LAQPAVIPAWFIAAPANFFVDWWHAAQSARVGIWFAGMVLRPLTPAKAFPASWQLAHPCVMPA
jgi:hypothetical protein